MKIDVVSASAGTGKTYHLTGEVTRALTSGAARPEGIVAITYTKKAAAELASRLRTNLIQSGRADLAGRIRDGYLGTVHSICERLLREFALEGGHSPYLEPIAEGQRERLFARALAGVLAGREKTLEAMARRFGLEDWDTGPLRKIVEIARENGLDGQALRESGKRSVAGLLGYLPQATLAEDEYRRSLLAEAKAAERALVALDGSSKAAIDRREAVSELVRSLQGPGLPPWAAQVRPLRASWTRAEAPVVAQLVAAAESHLRCEAFHRDLRELTQGLFDLAADALDAYTEAKKASRLVDFQDQLALAASLLEQEDVAGALSGKLDLVVVDEFQDTSPMQLAVVAALARVTKRSIWVGDRKQAIFGFQGSDPVLMNEAMRFALGGREPVFLSESWRSRPPLVTFTSELFVRALAPYGFSEREVRIGTPAERPDPKELAAQPVLECWWWEAKTRTKMEAEAVADGVAKLLCEAPPVREREGTVRPLLRRDVAVLARMNVDCRKIAAALAARGIPTRTELSDLAKTPEAILVRSALALVADPTDGVAAMDVSYLAGRGAADPDGWLSARLVEAARSRAERESAEARSGPRLAAPLPFAEEPRVAALRALHERSATLAPAESLDAAIAAAGLLELLRTWPEPAQRIANVEALRGAARAYEDRCRVQRTAGTVVGLVEHLASLPREKDADLQAVLASEDAVTISTWHSAKGLEWPVVVLASLDFEKDRDVWSATIERPEAFDPERPLASRWVRFWPWPYGDLKTGLDFANQVDNGLEAARVHDDDLRERARLLYVAFTRARDRLVLAGGVKKGAPEIGALAPLVDAQGRAVLSLPVGGADSTARVHIGDASWPCRVREVVAAPVEPVAVAPAIRAWYDGAARAERPPELVTPSAELLAAQDPCRIVGVQQLAGRAVLEGAIDMASLGDAVHAFLAADRWTGQREDMAARLLKVFGVTGTIAPVALTRASDALRAYLDERYPGASWRREWPICARIRDRGADRLLRGEVDLFLEREDGFVVVDHKSFPGKDKERDDRVVAYGAQLGLYAFALTRALEKPLLGAFIHLPIRGEIVEVDVNPVVEAWAGRSAA